MASFVPTSYTGGTLHRFTQKLVAYEHAPRSSSSLSEDSPALSTLIFVPGLYDGLLTVPFIAEVLTESLPPSWRVVQPILSSSYVGWGTASLDSDVSEIGNLVAYIRSLRPSGKIVLMGHSTGSQDAMHYLIPSPSTLDGTTSTSSSSANQATRPPIDGAILQAPVSDREALGDSSVSAPDLATAINVAREYVKTGRSEDVLPSMTGTRAFGNAPVSARRFLSLVSPGPEHEGEDDYFSSDLPDSRLRTSFGRMGEGQNVLVLLSGSDQYMPASIDKERLYGRWALFMREGKVDLDLDSGVVPGGDHALTSCPMESKEDAAQRIVSFLKRVDGSSQASL